MGVRERSRAAAGPGRPAACSAAAARAADSPPEAGGRSRAAADPEAAGGKGLGEEWEDNNPATILLALNLRRNKKEEGPFQILFQIPQA
jgi:hypothetical protein